MNQQLLEHILRVSRYMAETRSLTPLLNYVTDEGIKIVGAEHGFVVLLGPDGKLDFRVKRGQGVENLGKAEDQISHSILSRVIGDRKPLVLRDAMNDPLFSDAASIAFLKLRSIMCVPLVSGGEALGAIYVENRTISNRFDENDLPPLVIFASQAATAIKNATINDRLEAQTQALDHANQKLSRLDKIKSDFITVAAHELRTPLTLIKGYTHLLEEEVTDGQSLNLLKGVMIGQRRLHEIVESMLDITEIDSQLLNVRPEPTSLAAIIKRLVFEFHSALQERQLTLTMDNLAALPMIQADPHLLFKAFYQLVVNAIKYTPDGGNIKVSGKLISETVTMPVIQVTVSDTGIGIDPIHHEQIFEKFYQVGRVAFHSSGKTKFKGGGPGLGLPIAQGIVHAHSGRIWVESPRCDEKNRPGSQFHVLLPVK